MVSGFSPEGPGQGPETPGDHSGTGGAEPRFSGRILPVSSSGSRVQRFSAGPAGPAAGLGSRGSQRVPAGPSSGSRVQRFSAGPGGSQQRVSGPAGPGSGPLLHRLGSNMAQGTSAHAQPPLRALSLHNKTSNITI